MTTQINGLTYQGKLISEHGNAIDRLGKVTNGLDLVLNNLGNATYNQGRHIQTLGRKVGEHDRLLQNHDRLLQNLVGNTSSSCFAALMCLISGVGVGTISYAVTTDCWQSSGFWQHVRCHFKYINPFSDVSNSARLLNTVPWIVAALSIGYLGNAVLNSLGLKATQEEKEKAALHKEIADLYKKQAAQDEALAKQADFNHKQVELFEVQFEAFQKQNALIRCQEGRGCPIL